MKLNLTQNRLAALLGVHSDTIYLLEKDKALLHVKYMIKLEQILECEICKYDEYLSFAKDTAKNIRTIRKTKSRKDFANELGVSLSVITSWENGYTFISRKYYALIKKQLQSN